MNNWNSENLIQIRKALLWVYAKEDGIIANHSDDIENFIVIKQNNIVSLAFMDTKVLQEDSNVSDTMSSIDIANPLYLIAKCTQAMMLALVFKPQPKRLYMLGFGGGRVPMVFQHYFPKLLIEASEVSQGVLQLAEICFGIIPNNRLNVSLQDGRQHLATFPKKYFDIILLDSFSGIGNHPNNLSTLEFYQLCKSRLSEGGVVATNLVDNNPYFKQKVATFCTAFKFTYQYDYKGIYLFFGSDTDNFDSNEFKQKAKEIASQYQFEFPYYENSEYVTPCHSKEFSTSILRDIEILQYDK